jgi:hypothetical protein
MVFRVVQWATGNVGRAAIEGIVSHPELELAGAWVHSKEKAGRDVGEICGLGALGVQATDDMHEILLLRPDCVLYAPLLPNRQEVVRILESGINVVTPLNWFYPGKRDVADLQAACERGDVTLHGTGIHPGGITERLPLSIAALTRAITHVRAEEFSDIRSYAATDVISNIMLFGKTPEQAKTSPMLMLLTEGFSQSIEMIADALGFDLDPEIRSTHEISVAAAPIESPIGTIEPGQVAARRLSWARGRTDPRRNRRCPLHPRRHQHQHRHQHRPSPKTSRRIGKRCWCRTSTPTTVRRAVRTRRCKCPRIRRRPYRAPPRFRCSC